MLLVTKGLSAPSPSWPWTCTLIWIWAPGGSPLSTVLCLCGLCRSSTVQLPWSRPAILQDTRKPCTSWTGPSTYGKQRRVCSSPGGGWSHTGPPSPAPIPLQRSLASHPLLPPHSSDALMSLVAMSSLTTSCDTLTVQDTCRVLGPRTMGSCIRTATSASPRWPFHGSSTGLDRLLSAEQKARSAGATKGKTLVLRLWLCSVAARLVDCNAWLCRTTMVRETLTEVTRRSG